MARIQINLGDKTLALVEQYAEAIGVTRSSLCSVLVAQGLMGYNPALLGGGKPPYPDKVKVKEKEFAPIDEVIAEAEGRSQAVNLEADNEE